MASWPRDLYTGPGGGLYTGASSNHYTSNWPPIPVLVDELRKRNMNNYADIIAKHFRID